MGLVCFRMKGSNEINEALLKKINGRGQLPTPLTQDESFVLIFLGVIHLVPSKIRETYFLRVAICSRFSEEEDMEVSWKEVKEAADEVLQENKKE